MQDDGREGLAMRYFVNGVVNRSCSRSCRSVHWRQANMLISPCLRGLQQQQHDLGHQPGKHQAPRTTNGGSPGPRADYLALRLLG